MSLTGLSTFKEGVSKIQELLSLRKGINLHLQEIKMVYPEETKRQSCISGSENNWAGLTETISEVKRMRQMEDLKISLINFKEKEVSFHSSKIDCVIKFPQLSCNSSASLVLYTKFKKNKNQKEEVSLFTIHSFVHK